jgi:hypothetical protein
MRCGSFGGRWNRGFGGEFSGLSGLYTGATEQMSVSEAFGVIYPACHGHFARGVNGSGTGVNCRDRYAYGGSLDNVSGIRTQVPLMDHGMLRNEKFTQSPSAARAGCDVSNAPRLRCSRLRHQSTTSF